MVDSTAIPSPGICPKCHVAIIGEPICTGMWSGAKPNGTPAGGGILTITCPKCRADLIAFQDVYNESGEVEEKYEFQLSQINWQLDDLKYG